MKKYFNRIISLFLVVLMLMPIISAVGFTASAETYSGTCGNNLTWSLDIATGILEIKGNGAMADYSYSSPPWSSYRSYLKTVNIANGVTSIGNYAFYFCTSITNVTIPDTVERIGNNAFYHCSHLISVTIPYGVACINDYAFYFCRDLTSVIIPKSVTSIGDYAFVCCDKLSNIIIPESVEYIGTHAFERCDALTNIVIPAGVKIIGSEAFFKCTGLISVNVNENNEYYSSDEYGVLYDKDKTVLIQYPVGNTRKSFVIPDSITTIEAGAFVDCSALTSIEIPNGVISINEGAFGGCSGLTIITIPDSLTTIGEGAFVNCSGLTSVEISDSVTSIGDYAFYGCIRLKSITIPDSVTCIGDYAFCYLSEPDYNECKLDIIIKCSINSCAYNYAVDNGFKYELIGNPAVTGNCGKDLTWTYDISACVLYISGNGDMNDYYYSTTPWHDYMMDVETVIIDSGVTSIGKYAFAYFYSLENVTIPGTVTSIGDYAFAYCDCLTEVTIPDGVTEIGSRAFTYCEGLTELAVPESVKSIGKFAFGDCSSLTKADISEGVISIGACAFSYCDSLTDIIIPSTVKSIGNSAFDGCTALKSVIIPDGVKSIENYTFNDCISLTSVIIPESVASIGEYAFAGCRGLVNLTIPDSVTYIGEYAFYYCNPDFKIKCHEGSFAETYALENSITVEYIYERTLSTDNYDISLYDAGNISYIRYAKGEYATASAIKNAEGCVTLNASKVADYSDSGICKLTMADGGIYSVWVKYTDGTESIYVADLSVMIQEVVTDGVTVTVKNLYGVKDYFIAKGEHTTYSDVKANSVVQITKNKIGTKHDYTYILSEPGVYTVCVRYDDTTRAHKFMTVELTVTEPTFTANGLQLKVGNLDGVKVIRTAYGEYKTPGEIKRAQGTRAFTAKTIAKSGEEYTIQYRENGIVTVAVVYNNGYEVIYKYNVTKKTPAITQEGSTLTFGNLDDLKVIRYAEGIYTTSNQIKNAHGSKSIQGYKIETESYSVTLTPGTYTFCVQYNDESYNYYTVVIS